MGAGATKGFKDATTTMGPVTLWGANMWGGCTNLIVRPSVDKCYIRTDPYTSTHNTTAIPPTNPGGNLWATTQPSLVTITDTQVNLTENNGSQTAIYSLDRFVGDLKANYPTRHLTYTLSATNKGTTDWNVIMAFRMNKPNSASWSTDVNAFTIQINPNIVYLKRMQNGVLQENQSLALSLSDGINHTFDVTINGATKKVTLIIDGNQSNKLEITCSTIPNYGGFNLMAMKSDVILTNFVNETGDNLN